MKKIEFGKLLFKIAFCTMACDGHIDKREIEELKIMDKKTSFFGLIDLSDELELLLELFKANGHKVIKGMLNDLSGLNLNVIQELIILEVALRIINADEKQDDNEIRFINLLRSRLIVSNELIKDRFGAIEILRSSIDKGDDCEISKFNLEFGQSDFDINSFFK